MRASRPALPSPVSHATPEGFSLMPLVDPFEARVGPIFELDKRQDGEVVAAFYVDERHLREDEIVHEGMMMTFADSIMGTCAGRALGRGTIVTLSMQASYLAPARKGDLIRCHTRFERRSSSFMFNSGRFLVGDRLVMTANCLWKILNLPKPAAG